ncbi:prominin-2-like [Salminus brasiliensis]|uniref:prominin-2-like n=1 Tax=Salminus brasiliensis TaxID=930266 RepID=UPI003B833B09
MCCPNTYGPIFMLLYYRICVNLIDLLSYHSPPPPTLTFIFRQELIGPVTMLPLSSRTMLVLLWLTAVSSAALNECPPDHVDPIYQLNLSHTPADRLISSAGSLEPLYNFARLFLQAVQPYGLPLDIASQTSQNGAAISEVLGFEAGYVVCLILAVLYAVIIPVVGAVFVWRYFRYRNVPIESEVPSALPWHQRSIIVITCLSVTVILLLSGVILTFTTNNRMHQNMGPNLSHLREDFRDMEEALSSVPEKVEFIVKQFPYFHEEITTELIETGALIGKAILASLSREINMTLNRLGITVQDATGAQRHLQEVKEVRNNMQDTYGFLQTELGQMRSRLYNLDSSLDTSGLDTDANYELIPSVDAQVQRLSFVPEFDVKVQKVKTSINSIPQVCEDQITPTIEAWLVKLNKTQNVFRNYSKRLPSLKSLSEAASDMGASLDESMADLQYYDDVRWSVSAVFCILLLIITLLMLAGLVIGASVVISPTLYPFHLQDQLRMTAVYLLYIALGMIFFLSWLFIIMVFINLFFAGNIHALACRSATNGEIFRYLDEQDYLFSSLNAQDPDTVSTNLSSTASPANATTSLFLNVTNGTSYQEPDHQMKQDIKTYEIYRGCQVGISLFYSLHMDKSFNMDRFLNASMYLIELSKSMTSLNIQLDDLSALLNATQATVKQFKDSGNLDQIKYSDFQTLLARPIVKTDLDAFAGQLEIAALSADGSIRENLTNEAAKARQLAKKGRLQDSYRRNMSASIEALDTISHNYKTNADSALLSTSETENSLRFEVPYIVQDVSQCMMEKGSNLVTQFLDVVRYAIIDQALDCLWLPVSLANMYTATCDNLIGPWNAFWLSLGWCCAFLIPAIIFSILAARLWKPPPPTNKEPFHMPNDIIDKGTLDTCVTLDHMKGKSRREPTTKAKDNIYETMDFKERGDTKKTNYNVYMTLDDVMGCDGAQKGRKEKEGVPT